jgi:choline dehydrogenase
MRFDVLIVGGGTAGCVLAARLSESEDRHVCLLEAGPDYGPLAEGRWPDELLDARRLAFSHSWPTDREDRSQLRARVIGGCSSHNACVALRGAPADYDEWGPGWTYADLEPFLAAAEKALGVHTLPDEALSPWHRAFRESAGGISHPVNLRGRTRWNAAFAYLDPARGRRNLTILANTLVERIALEPLQAITTRGEITADSIVLTAGAYGTPGILLRSGIGPASELPEHGIDVVLELPVGEGLTDHVGVGLGWEGTPELRAELDAFAAEHDVFMAQVSVLAPSSDCPAGLWDILVFPAVDDDLSISAAVFAMKPRSHGRVRLNAPQAEVALRIDHGFLADEQDAHVVAQGVELARELARSGARARLAGREVRPGPEVTALEHARLAARGFFHPVGTCALGAVCDSEGRVLGLERLYVADASLLPTIPRANTNLSVAAVAEKIATLV